MSEEPKKNENEEASLKKEEKIKIRYEWLDQFRGLVMLLFIISVVTWIMSKNGDILQGEFPFAPVYYDHGWRLYNSYYSGEHKYDPYIITVIDIGQQIFMFLVGFMQAFAYIKRKEKYGIKDARKHLFTRWFWIMFLSFGDNTSFFTDIMDPEGWLWGFLFESTLTQIAWGGLFAGILTDRIDDPQKRFYVGLGILAFHFGLYFDQDLWFWSYGWFKFPWGLLGHLSITAIASAYTEWFFNRDFTINKKGIRERVLPVSATMLASNYIIDYLQWAEHHHVNAALIVLSVGTSGFMLFIFYTLDQWDFHLPGLTAFGKNMLMMFILSLLISEVYMPLVSDYLFISRAITTVLAGIIPILIMWAIAKFLEVKNIIIKI